MTASDSFRATILFSVLALGGLLLGNLAAAIAGGRGWATLGVMASLVAIGAAYGCQLMTTNGLTLDEGAAQVTNQTDLQTVREAAAQLHQWARTLQLVSLVAAAVAGLALVMAL
jgi:hypothetical protein